MTLHSNFSLFVSVLVISSVSRGENDPTDAPERTNEGTVTTDLINQPFIVITVCCVLPCTKLKWFPNPAKIAIAR